MAKAVARAEWLLLLLDFPASDASVAFTPSPWQKLNFENLEQRGLVSPSRRVDSIWAFVKSGIIWLALPVWVGTVNIHSQTEPKTASFTGSSCYYFLPHFWRFPDARRRPSLILKSAPALHCTLPDSGLFTSLSLLKKATLRQLTANVTVARFWGPRSLLGYAGSFGFPKACLTWLLPRRGFQTLSSFSFPGTLPRGASAGSETLFPGGGISPPSPSGCRFKWAI